MVLAITDVCIAVCIDGIVLEYGSAMRTIGRLYMDSPDVLADIANALQLVMQTMRIPFFVAQVKWAREWGKNCQVIWRDLTSGLGCSIIIVPARLSTANVPVLR